MHLYHALSNKERLASYRSQEHAVYDIDMHAVRPMRVANEGNTANLNKYQLIWPACEQESLVWPACEQESLVWPACEQESHN